jgi:bifunctional non-homologous end joining protein LigD
MAPAKAEAVELTVGDQTVRVTNPSKPYFPQAQLTKLDVVQYFVAVADAALVGVRGRPMALKRWPDGIEGEYFFQKRAPPGRPDWVETVTLKFPSGNTADEVVVRDAAGLAWVATLGCLDLNPHAVRVEDLEHPDELRIDLDPQPQVPWSQVREVAQVVREVLEGLGYVAFPKTSGSRGIHVYARIEPRWGFDEMRRAALAVAREVERRAPTLATSKWWKEERHGVFLDYNQNAKDRTVASAWSVRALPDARVSMPFAWSELPTIDAADFTVKTAPQRLKEQGDLGAAIDAKMFSLEPLLELVRRHEAEGQGDAPWPPHYRKQQGEPARVQPSKRKKKKEEPDR